MQGSTAHLLPADDDKILNWVMETKTRYKLLFLRERERILCKLLQTVHWWWWSSVVLFAKIIVEDYTNHHALSAARNIFHTSETLK